MTTSVLAGATVARARLHVVTGKGGTGKTTVAAALALALATGGRRVLLIEVEGRQGIAQLFDTRSRCPTPRSASRPRPAAVRCARCTWTPRRRCSSTSRCSTTWASPAGRCAGWARSSSPPRSRPACATCCSPARSRSASAAPATNGRHVYDAVVLDAPPTGRIVKFLDVTKAMADLAKVGPIKGQSDGVVRLLHSGDTAVHLVTLLEEMPVRETIDAVAELDGRRPAARRGDRQPGPPAAAARPVGDRRRGRPGRRRPGARRADQRPGWSWPTRIVDGLVDETVEHAIRVLAEQDAHASSSPRSTCRRVELPELHRRHRHGRALRAGRALVDQGVR